MPKETIETISGLSPEEEQIQEEREEFEKGVKQETKKEKGTIKDFVGRVFAPEKRREEEVIDEIHKLALEEKESRGECVSLDFLKKIVQDFSQKGRIARLLHDCEIIKWITKTGQKVNSLSGQCATGLVELKNYCEKNHVTTKITESSKSGVHSWLECETKQGKIIIDCALGQFVKYNEIFVGTINELKEIFLDSKREWFMGKRIWAIDRDITSREEWFNILYS